MAPLLEQTPTPSQLEEAKAAGFTHYPILIEIIEDVLTPVGLYLKLRKFGENSFLLESAEGGEHIGRYSFMGVAPFASFIVEEGVVTRKIGSQSTSAKASPVSALREFFLQFKVFPVQNLPRFSGGAVGYFGYDFVRYLEQIKMHEAENPLPEVFLNFYETILVVDNLKRKVLLISLLPLTEPSGTLPEKLKERVGYLAKVKEFVEDADSEDDNNFCDIGEAKFNFTREAYTQIVSKAKDYIVEGDIFQVVLSQRAELEIEGDPFLLYRGVRTLNPSPYMFYLDSIHRGRHIAVIGSSPEMFVRKEGNHIEVRPIAGTSPRGMDPNSDEELASKLLANEKERAEHVMLVDLGRNDIGRVAQTGSVHINNFMHIERFSHVMHIVSDVVGTVDADCDAIETLAACFPAGTLSGAPKVRAMEIISELENARRQIYGGAVGYIDFNNNMDTCIAIRTFVVDGNKVFLQAGAGIVNDSEPEKEYDETLNKMRANLEAVKLVGHFSKRGRNRR